MPELGEMVKIEITEPLPESGVVDTTYKIEGTAKMFDNIGVPPWIYAEVRFKEWWKPEITEEVSYERGFPVPVAGDFSIDFKPKKEGDYQVTVVATPAPLSLPVVGVFPITGKSDVMKVSVGEKPPAAFRFSGVNIDGYEILLVDKDADSGLLLEKTTADYLDIIPAFEWIGPSKIATISIKAGYKSPLGFAPKTGAYTQSIILPESPTEPYSGQLESPIRIPLTACGGLTDGAIEIVLKIAGEPDYISHIWNVYSTKISAEFRFSSVIIDGYTVALTNHDADSGLLLEKTTADYLDINPAFEWIGPEKDVVISIKAGYKSLLGFAPKTGAYTRSIILPRSPELFSGQLESPIRIPLIACGGLHDGAIEIVLKIPGEPDYISHIWNVYSTKVPEVKELFDILGVTVNDRTTTNKITETDFDFDIPEPMTTADKLNVNFDFQWVGPKTTVTVKMRAGHEAVIPHDFAPKTGYYSATVELPAASEDEPFTGRLSKPITIPLSGCANLDDGAIEIKVDAYTSQIWNVYNTKALETEILEVRIDPYGAGFVTTDPEPVGGVEHKWTFIHGTEVYVTAHPNPGYDFKSWSGEMTDTTSETAPVYPMTEHRLITAHFEKVGVVAPKVEIVEMVVT